MASVPCGPSGLAKGDKGCDAPRLQGAMLAGDSSRQKATTAVEKSLPCLQGELVARRAPFPLSGAETDALTLLTGLSFSPGSQRSTMAKGQRQGSKDLALLIARSLCAKPATAP